MQAAIAIKRNKKTRLFSQGRLRYKLHILT